MDMPTSSMPLMQILVVNLYPATYTLHMDMPTSSMPLTQILVVTPLSCHLYIAHGHASF